MKRTDIVEEARRWKDTPFLHQGRLLGQGVDCAGLIELVPKALGYYIDANVITNYRMQPDPKKMGKILATHLDQIAFKNLLPGDIIWFRIAMSPQHLAIVSGIRPLTIIHASNVDRRVVETPVNQSWELRVQGCYRYRGIEE